MSLIGSPRFIAMIRWTLLAALLLGNLFLCGALVMPQWRAYDAAEATISAQQTEIAQRSNAPTDDNALVAQERLTGAQTERAEASSYFLTGAQADLVLNNLYDTAARSGVNIRRLEVQSPDPLATPSVYRTRNYNVEVEGPMRYLMVFISALRVATIPTVQIGGLTLEGDELAALLRMQVAIYEADFASGAAFEHIAQNLPPTLTPTPLPTSTGHPTATLTPSPTPTFTPSITPPPIRLITLAPTLPTATLMPTAVPPTAVPTSAPAQVDATIEAIISGESTCPEAPQTLFAVGQTAVVDFNGIGALRIMTWVTGGAVDTVAQAYDGQPLEILAGPVCGHWDGLPTLYWYVEMDRIRGWAAEGTTAERWLCTVDEPECSER